MDKRLKRAINALAPAYRTVLLLWAIEGFKCREIAEITEVAIGTMMSRLFRRGRSSASKWPASPPSGG